MEPPESLAVAVRPPCRGCGRSMEDFIEDYEWCDDCGCQGVPEFGDPPCFLELGHPSPCRFTPFPNWLRSIEDVEAFLRGG